jgi:membrane associated rhomboid family serine protease
MFFPYRDDNPLHHGPPVITIGIIAICTMLYFFVQFPMDGRAEQAHIYGFGFIPVVFFGDADLPVELSRIPAVTTLITCMFLHGGLMHLIGNMWFLWLYGDNVEEAFGRLRYLAFYLICGCAGTLAHAFIDPGSRVPLIGASGAISGVIAAYLMIWPRANIRVFYWWIIFFGTINVPAFVVLGFWLFEQFVALPAALQMQGGVAIAAHLGGFVCGLILTPLFKRPSVKLFQQKHTAAFSRIPVKSFRKSRGSVPTVPLKRRGK